MIFRDGRRLSANFSLSPFPSGPTAPHVPTKDQVWPGCGSLAHISNFTSILSKKHFERTPICVRILKQKSNFWQYLAGRLMMLDDAWCFIIPLGNLGSEDGHDRGWRRWKSWMREEGAATEVHVNWWNLLWGFSCLGMCCITDLKDMPWKSVPWCFFSCRWFLLTLF